MDDAYTRLAHAIVVLAAKDYDAELDWFRQNPTKEIWEKLNFLLLFCCFIRKYVLSYMRPKGEDTL